MIPVKLSIRNFMCYRDNVPPLSFEGIHTACISGDNGNGKSALIDAITWALWGKARAKSDDDLIHLGQTDMEVEFDFAVGKQLYRIIRKRSKPKRRGGSGKTILELQIATEGGFKTITGDSISQTQHKIVADILHMDYDTFINSAFLRQGHADEFTKQTPVARKQVLADILGLSSYDELEERAKQLASQQEIERAQLGNAIQEIGGELAHKPAYEDELEQAQDQLSQIDKTAKGRESRVDSLRQEKEALENKKAQLAQLEKHMTEMTRGLERWEEQAKQHRSRAKEYEHLIARRSVIEEGYAQFAEAKKLSTELEQKFRLATSLNEHRHRLELTITQAGQALIKDHALAQNRIKELETSSERLPSLKNERQQMQAQLNQLAEREEILVGKKQSSQELQTEVNYLESAKTHLEREIKEIREKLDLLSTKSGNKCPLCDSELETEGLELIRTRYTTDRGNSLASLKSNQAKLTEKKKQLQSLGSEIFQLETRLNKDRASSQHRVSLLDKEIADAEQDGAG